MLSTAENQHVLTKEVGDKAVIILNRPKSLNALGTILNRQLTESLRKCINEKSLIILKGAGDKAFSAGGDLLEVKACFEDGQWKKLTELIVDLNINIYLIHTSKVPVIAFMNGITFGGGAGISSFATYKIATENTQFAMPESKIAFHPNSGGTYFLNRAKGRLGYYLGLTGNTLKGSDVFQAGFATHYCLSKNLKTLEKAILYSSKQDSINEIINDICERNIPDFSLAPVKDSIDRCFAAPTVEDILKKLDEDGSDWAKKTVENLRKYSPTSLKVILRQLQKGRHFNLEECLVMESNLTVNFYHFPDVIEGEFMVK